MSPSRTWIGLLLLFWVTGAAALSTGGSGSTDSGLASAISLLRSEGPDAALPEFQALLERFESTGDEANATVALRFMGESEWRLGDYEAARAHLGRSHALALRRADQPAVGKALSLLGLIEWDLGNYGAALSALNTALPIAVETGDELLRANVLNNLSLVQDELGDYTTSQRQYQEAYDIFTELDDLRGQGNAIGNLGGVHLLLGHYATALEYYQRALELSREMGSKTAMTIDHGNIGLCYHGLGKMQHALAHFDQALDLARETGLKLEEAFWLRGKANTLIVTGQHDRGLQNQREALGIYEEIGARPQQVDALHDLGQTHLELGDPVSAEAYFNDAIELARAIGLQQAITVNQLALGDLQADRGLLEPATALYAQALASADEAGELAYQAEGLLRLAALDRQRGQYQQAVVRAERAIEIAGQSGATLLEARGWLERGEIAREQGHAESAHEAYATALRVSGEDAGPDLRWQLHFGAGRVRAGQGDWPGAVEALQAAVEIIESVRGRLAEERFRSGYLQDKYQVYIELVQAQLKLGRTRDAFSTAERLRARSFLAQLDAAGPVARSEAERETETFHRERIRQLQELLEAERERTRGDRRQMAVDAFSSELMLAERDYQAFLDDLDREAAQLEGLALPGLEEIQRQLGPAQALVEYVVADHSTLVFLLRPNGITASTIKVSADELKAKVDLVRAMVQRPGSPLWRKPAASLSGLLIAPLLDTGGLAGISHLHLVPHGILNYLPFAMLPAPTDHGEALIDSYTLSYLPAAANLVLGDPLAQRPRALLALAPGNVQLQFAPQEARAISAIFRPHSRLLVGAAATESSFKADAGNFDILHLATHGNFNRENPMLSAVELEADAANDGLLEVHEIMELNLKSELVTLSACQTGLGAGWFNAIPAGDEFVGLTRAFLYAGSQSVLATLWEVDDRSTVELMEGFYQSIATSSAPRDRAAALAAVQRRLRTSDSYSHPYYWAPFVLVGQHGNRTGRS